MKTDPYSFIINGLLTFTRASNATRVNAAGLIETVPANTARLDHDPLTLAEKGLLIEESRTNLIYAPLKSWFTFIGATSNNNATDVSPDGAHNSKMLVFPSDYAGAFLELAGSPSTTFVYTAFVKSNISTQIRIVINMNLSDPEIKLAAVTPQWQRIIVTKTTSPGTTRVTAQLQDGGQGLGSRFDVWGHQLEVGAFPTTYIPTTTAPATRVADLASITGTNFTSWYNPAQGTFSVEFQTIFTADSIPRYILTISCT